MVGATSRASLIGASPTQHEPSSNWSRTAAATRSATLVLPVPPAPVRVTRRHPGVEGLSSRARSAGPCSRPIKLVSSAGSDWAPPDGASMRTGRRPRPAVPSCCAGVNPRLSLSRRTGFDARISPRAAFQVGNAPNAQVRSGGKRFLGQARRHPVGAQQFAKAPRLFQGFSPKHPKLAPTGGACRKRTTRDWATASVSALVAHGGDHDLNLEWPLTSAGTGSNSTNPWRR